MATLAIADSNGCWIDLHGGRRFTGQRRRLYGPADFPMLRIRENGGSDEARSVRVGPSGYAQFFAQRQFHETVCWLLPNDELPDAAKLRAAEPVDALRRWARPPFAHAPGYAAYMLWAASHVARKRGKG